MLKAFLLVIITSIITITPLVDAGDDVFTAMSDLEDVLETETKMLRGVDEYLRQEKQRIEQIERKLDNLKRLNRESLEDKEGYLSHPMNAYLLIKRFIWEWVDLENWIQVSMPSREYIYNATKLWKRAPTQSDLDGAAESLWRLQDTYKIDAAALIDGAKMDPALTAHHCFEVGRLAYHGAQDFRHAIKWLAEAHRRLNNETINGDFFNLNETEILDHLAFATFSEGHLREALSYTDKLIELSPDIKRYKDNKNYYEFLLAKQERPRGEMGDLKGVDWEKLEEEEAEERARMVEEEDGRKVSTEKHQYEALCRGEASPTKHSRSLGCRYQTNSHPLLVLQPSKEEVVSQHPRLVVFRDIIKDREIEIIKNLAKSRLERATIWNSTSGALEPSKHRISKSGWVKRNEASVIERIYRRMEAVTGLDVQSAEDLQVVNYGLAGHYDPHFDFTQSSSVYTSGNRIATVLFYLSDVGGGATVFPDIGVTVEPEKGSAIFWYNLHRSGKKDLDTKHAACPVLNGSKWVANIWMHEHGQELRRPCGLQREE